MRKSESEAVDQIDREIALNYRFSVLRLHHLSEREVWTYIDKLLDHRNAITRWGAGRVPAVKHARVSFLFRPGILRRPPE